MSRSALAWLLAALAALAVIAAILAGGNRFGQRGAQATLLPGLREHLNDIREIKVTGPGNAVIATLQLVDGRWLLSERSNYPADVGRIRQNLLALADATIVEEKTSNPELYERLGVGDIGDKDGRGLQLEIRQADGTQQAVIIGDAGQGGDRVYARRAGEAASWLVSGRFDLGRTTGEWLDRNLLDIDAGRVRRVTISHGNAAPLRIVKATRETTDFAVENLPKGRDLTFPSAANSVGGVLSALTLDDVQRADSLPASSSVPVTARFETFDGLIVEFRGVRVPDGTRFTLAASAEPTAAAATAPVETKTAPPGEPAAAGTGKAEPAAAPDPASEAGAINARVGGWAYTLPGFKTEQLTRRLEDLLAPAAG